MIKYDPLIFRFKEVESTNKTLNSLLAQQDVPEFSVVIAQGQSAGRGYNGNSWESLPGNNLTFSFLLNPHFIEVNCQFSITQLVSLSLFELLNRYTADISIKWPNDIYYRDSKICGVLIENTLTGNRISSCVVGIGLNLNQTSFSSFLPNPVSLKDITGDTYSVEAMMNQFMAILIENYLKWYELGDVNHFYNDYMLKLYRGDNYYKYEDESGVFKAKPLLVKPSGHLLLKRSDGTVKEYSFKELKFII
ncbi:biotin--[acetyl-CoA-carboxylase] ligase [Marinilabiliaceae bacterium ANBcel2]|nr:biotin--[acetyl-CoA-carboxylase] ligase [Marinilabiliaceae bacterium ANBcel2]